MATDQNQNDKSKQSECDCLKKDIEANNRLLDNLKRLRTNYILNEDLDSLKTTAITIQQLEDENAAMSAARRKIGCDDKQVLPGINDNQTVISTSSVRRKDTSALEKIIKPTTVGTAN